MFSHTNLLWYYYKLVGASALDDLAFPSHVLSTHTTVYKYKMYPIVGSEVTCLYYPV